MSKYYMLECYGDEIKDFAVIKAVYIKGLGSWRIGKPFSVPPPEPLDIKIMDNNPDNLLEYYNMDAIVMTKRLHQALTETGVDNMDTYACIITNPETGFKTEDYVAVNLIGLVKAVDIARSNVTGGSRDHMLDTDFDGLTIDEKKAGGQLMFRLLENTSAIMIHERVKDHLLKKGFDMLTFVPPEKWIG